MTHPLAELEDLTRRNVERVSVDVPDGVGGTRAVDVLLRTASAADLADILPLLEDPTPAQGFEAMARLIVACGANPDGSRKYSPDDLPTVREIPPDTLSALGQAALDASGFGAGEEGGRAQLRAVLGSAPPGN